MHRKPLKLDFRFICTPDISTKKPPLPRPTFELIKTHFELPKGLNIWKKSVPDFLKKSASRMKTGSNPVGPYKGGSQRADIFLGRHPCLRRGEGVSKNGNFDQIGFAGQITITRGLFCYAAFGNIRKTFAACWRVASLLLNAPIRIGTNRSMLVAFSAA